MPVAVRPPQLSIIQLLLLKCPFALTPEQHLRLRAIRPAQLGGDGKKRTVERRAIIVRQLDQIGLGDQAAQLDQLPGSFAAFDLPFAHVGSRLCCLKPMPCRH